MTESIRAVAVAVCRSGNRVLVERGYDRVTHQHFFRAIGGGVAFGERAAEAVMREWWEELGLALDAPEPLGVLENIFSYDGEPRHEIVFVFTARLRDQRSTAGFTATDTDGRTHTVVWMDLDELQRDSRPLYPNGLLELLNPSR